MANRAWILGVVALAACGGSSASGPRVTPGWPTKPGPTHACQGTRITEKTVIVKCHNKGAVAKREGWGPILGDAYLAAVKEANGTASTWIQAMGSDVTPQLSAPICQTEETGGSVALKVAYVLASAASGASSATTHTEATCRDTGYGTVQCEGTQTTRRPVQVGPAPQGTYETICSDPQVVGLDIEFRYELLTDAEASARGGRSEDPLRAEVALWRDIAATMIAK